MTQFLRDNPEVLDPHQKIDEEEHFRRWIANRETLLWLAYAARTRRSRIVASRSVAPSTHGDHTEKRRNLGGSTKMLLITWVSGGLRSSEQT